MGLDGVNSLRKRITILALSLSLGLTTISMSQGQQSADPALEAQLKRLFPEAARFSPKEGNPAHFKAYGPAATGQEPEVLGLAWWTTEVEPLERGYDGPIKILVGMDMTGILKGIIVAQHREPYGDFSIDPPEFAAQFKNKNIREPFKVGQDIDAISRATITVTGATRAVRNSSRRIARGLLTPPKQE